MSAADRPTLARLREVAAAATPGPWLLDRRDDGRCWLDLPGVDGHALGLHGWRENAEHIATFDPPTVTALLDELEALREVVAAVGESLADVMHEHDRNDRSRHCRCLGCTLANRLRAVLDGAPTKGQATDA